MGKTHLFIVTVQTSPLSANKNPLFVRNIGPMAQTRDYNYPLCLGPASSPGQA